MLFALLATADCPSSRDSKNEARVCPLSTYLSLRVVQYLLNSAMTVPARGIARRGMACPLSLTNRDRVLRAPCLISSLLEKCHQIRAASPFQLSSSS